MATVMGGVGYGLYFVAKVIRASQKVLQVADDLIALCLSYDCAAYPTTTRTRQAGYR